MNHTILELVISSFVIIIITTINTCQDLSKIQSPNLYVHRRLSRLFLSLRYHWFREEGAPTTFCATQVLECLECLLFLFWPCGLANRLAGWPARYRGVTPLAW